jgi:transcriptional regulator with XRE-family HTH domain
MKTQFDFNELFEGAKETLAYKAEMAVLEFTEDLVAQMACKGVSRSELARKIGCSPAYVTKILRGSTNFTLETMVKVADVLGCKVRTHLQPEGAQTRWFDLVEHAPVPAAAFQTGKDLRDAFHQYSRCGDTSVRKEAGNGSLSAAS